MQSGSSLSHHGGSEDFQSKGEVQTNAGDYNYDRADEIINEFGDKGGDDLYYGK